MILRSHDGHPAACQPDKFEREQRSDQHQDGNRHHDGFLTGLAVEIPTLLGRW